MVIACGSFICDALFLQLRGALIIIITHTSWYGTRFKFRIMVRSILLWWSWRLFNTGILFFENEKFHRKKMFFFVCPPPLQSRLSTRVCHAASQDIIGRAPSSRDGYVVTYWQSAIWVVSLRACAPPFPRKVSIDCFEHKYFIIFCFFKVFFIVL